MFIFPRYFTSLDIKSVFYWSGRGGASIFGKQFEDELSTELKFTGNRSGKILLKYKVVDVEEVNIGQ